MKIFLRWLLPILFTVVALPLVVDYLKKSNPTAADYQTMVGSIWASLIAFANLPWVLPLAIFIGGVMVGTWVDWLARRFDGSRAAQKRSIGYELLQLAERIRKRQRGFNGEWPDNIGDMLPEIGSALMSAQKMGVPILPPEAFRRANTYDLAVGYLMVVGRFLADGHFTEAELHAVEAYTEFAKDHT